jgi:hypothetical protein
MSSTDAIWFPTTARTCPDFGVYIKVQGPKDSRIPGALAPARALLRGAPQGLADAAKQGRHREPEYKAQRSILADVDAAKISNKELFARAEELMKERLKNDPARPAHAPAARRWCASRRAWPAAAKRTGSSTLYPPGRDLSTQGRRDAEKKSSCSSASPREVQDRC